MGPLTEATIWVELWVKEAEPSARWRQPRAAVGWGRGEAIVGWWIGSGGGMGVDLIEPHVGLRAHVIWKL